VLACGAPHSPAASPARSADRGVPAASPTFGDDLAFLRQHVPDLVVLERGEARVAVAPLYQGRVMTSSARGEGGASYGFIHRPAIASGQRAAHINVFGGEDRFWLGPEGGQFSLFFAPGTPFDLEHWQTPEAIDWGAWDVIDRSAEDVSFRRDMQLVNTSGTTLAIRADRRVRLLPDAEVGDLFAEGAAPGGVDVVGYQSINAVTNTGQAAWTAETALVSIWILGMYPHSPRATVVIPFRRDGSGPIVNDAYFGEVPADRLRVDEAAGVVFFSADGARRSKIGVPFARATPMLGSWDAERGVLTIVRYSLPGDPGPGYVNSMWEQQTAPYAGDVVNSYNDGPLAEGQPPLGPFYELETSSPALALAPGARAEHVHTTFHLEGPREALDAIARARLGVGLDAIESALAR
jgi:hypothetical protein